MAAFLARSSDLGQIWHVQKAVVYRAMDRLEQFGYTPGGLAARPGAMAERVNLGHTPGGNKAADLVPLSIRLPLLMTVAVRN